MLYHVVRGYRLLPGVPEHLADVLENARRAATHRRARVVVGLEDEVVLEDVVLGNRRVFGSIKQPDRFLVRYEAAEHVAPGVSPLVLAWIDVLIHGDSIRATHRLMTRSGVALGDVEVEAAQAEASAEEPVHPSLDWLTWNGNRGHLVDRQNPDDVLVAGWGRLDARNLLRAVCPDENPTAARDEIALFPLMNVSGVWNATLVRLEMENGVVVEILYGSPQSPRPEPLAARLWLHVERPCVNVTREQLKGLRQRERETMLPNLLGLAGQAVAWDCVEEGPIH